MIDFDWYRSFVAIYQIGTVTGAAEARFLTQPAVTQHLAALEAAVGTALFIRTSRRMQPTQQGKALYTQVVQALEKLEQVSQELRRQATPEQPLIRLGTPLEYFYEKALLQLAEAPFRLWVQFGVAQSLVEELERGELDVVIATQRIAVRDLEYKKLDDECFKLVGSPDVVPPETDHLTELENWLAAQKWISYGVELPIIRRFWQQSFKRRPEFQPALVIPDLHSIEKAVELGFGISLLPDYLCQEALEIGRLRVLWEPQQPVVNELWLAYRKRNELALRFAKVMMACTQSN